MASPMPTEPVAAGASATSTPSGPAEAEPEAEAGGGAAIGDQPPPGSRGEADRVALATPQEILASGMASPMPTEPVAAGASATSTPPGPAEAEAEAEGGGGAAIGDQPPPGSCGEADRVALATPQEWTPSRGGGRRMSEFYNSAGLPEGLSSPSPTRDYPDKVPGSWRDQSAVPALALAPAVGSPTSTGLSGGAAMGDASSVEFVVSAMTRRQAEWDRQLESVDQKQAELLTIQWKLVREQTGTLARELAIVQQQLKDLKVDSRRAVVEVERYFKENETKLNEERGLRLAMFESLEQRQKKVRQELESEVKQRACADAELPPKIDALVETMEARARDQHNIEMELQNLRRVVEGSLEELDALKDALTQQAGERRMAEAVVAEKFRELREALQKESRERHAMHEEHVRTHFATVEQEKADRNGAFTSLKERIAGLQKDLAPHKEELPVLRNRLQEVEGLLNTRMKDNHKSFERELAERAVVHQKLERRVAELTLVADKEAAARAAQHDECEQMLKTFRMKMKSMFAEQAEAARAGREDVQAMLSEQIERESALREAQSATLLDQMTSQNATLDVRVDTLDASLRDVEQRFSDERGAECREWEASHQRLSDEFARQLRDLRDVLQTKLTDERAAREQQAASLEENVDFLDRFLQDVRELFLQRGGRSRQLATRKSREPLSSSSPGPAAGKSIPVLAVTTGVAAGGGVGGGGAGASAARPPSPAAFAVVTALASNGTGL